MGTKIPSLVRVATLFAGWATLAAPLASAAEPQSLTRWAILASPELQANGISDLLTAELSQTDVALVEREQLAAAQRELELSSLLADDGAAGRLKLGRLVKADALGLLSLQKLPADAKGKETNVVRLAIADCRYGARLRTEQFAANTPAAELAKACAATIADVRKQFAGGVQLLIAVPPLASKNLGHHWDALQMAYAELAANALAAQPGVAVLEVGEARAVAKELALGGEERQGRAVPLFVAGEFEMSTLVPGDDTTVSLQIKVFDDGGEKFAIDETAVSLLEVPKLLSGDLPARVLKLLQGDDVRPLSSDGQLRRLVDRADRFASLGDWQHAADVREAGLLLDSANVEQTLLVVRDYFQLLNRPVANPLRHWPANREQIDRDAARRRGQWQALVGHVERLIRRRKVNPREADVLMLAVTRTSTFQGSCGLEPWRKENDGLMRSLADRAWMQPTPPEVRKQLDQLFQQVYPLFPQLEPGDGQVRPSLQPIVTRERPLSDALRLLQQRPQLTPVEQKILWTNGMFANVKQAVHSPMTCNHTNGFQCELSDGVVLSGFHHDTSRYHDTIQWLVTHVDYDRYAAIPSQEPTNYITSGWTEREPFMMKMIARHDAALDRLRAELARTGRVDVKFIGEAMWLDRECYRFRVQAVQYKSTRDPEVAPRLAVEKEKLVKHIATLREEVRASLASSPDAPPAQDPLARLAELEFGVVDYYAKLVEPFVNPVARTAKPERWVPMLEFTPEPRPFPAVIERMPTPGLVFDIAREPFRISKSLIATLPKGEVSTLYELPQWPKGQEPEDPVSRRVGGDTFWSIDWDGEHIWLASTMDGVRVIDRSGREVAHWNEARGLPTYNQQTILLRAIGPGECLAVGQKYMAIDSPRSFVALLTFRDGKAGEVRVLQSATKTVDDSDAADQTFFPLWTAFWSDPREPDRPWLLIGRCNNEYDDLGDFQRRPLMVDVKSKEVRVSPGRFPSVAVRYGQHRFTSTAEHEICIPTELGVYLVSPPAEGKPDWQKRAIGTETAKHRMVATTPIRLERKWVVRGFDDAWLYDPAANTAEHWAAQVKLPEGFVERSAYERVLGWNNAIYRMRVADDMPEGERLELRHKQVPPALRKQQDAAMEAINALGGQVGYNLDRGPTYAWIGREWRGGDDGLKHLAKLHNLQRLVVMGAPIHKEGMEHIGRCTSLQRLVLMESTLRDADLAPLANLKSLYELHLEGTFSGNEFSDAALAHVPRERLRRLRIYGSGFTDEAARFATSIPAVDHLFLRDTAVTGEFVREWKQRNPSRKFYFSFE